MARVKFGAFELDPLTGELWKGSIRNHLQEQPLQVLICLLERAGKVVTREELQQRVWGNTIHVNYEDGLNTAVSKLRQALEEAADDPVLIETLPRKGYRFLAPVAEELSGSVPSLRALAGLRKGAAPAPPPIPASLPPAERRAPEAAIRPRRAWLGRHPWWRLGVVGFALLGASLGAWRWVQFRGLNDSVPRVRGFGVATAGLELRPSQEVGANQEEVRRYLLGAQRGFEEGGAEGLRRSEALYRKAVVLDPGASDAHAGLSKLLQARCFGPWNPLDPTLTGVEAEREARLAVAADPRSALAHLRLGECLLYLRGDPLEGRREIERGAALDPGSPDAIQSRARLDLIHRRWDLATQGFKQVLHLSPLSFFAFEDLCRAHFYAGRDAENLELVRRGLELGPAMNPLLRWRAHSEARLGRLELAFRAHLEMLEAIWEPGESRTLLRKSLEAAFRRGGYPEFLSAAARQLEGKAERAYVPPFDIALLHAEARNPEACLKWLERGLAKGDPNLAFIHSFPGFDFLRGNRRFEAIAAQVRRGTHAS